MAVSLSNITSHDGKNMPGYKELYMIYDQEVTAIPSATAGDVASALTLATDKVFTKLDFDHEAGAFLTIEEPEAEGTTGYNYTLQGFVAGDTAAIRTAIDAADGVPCIFIGVKKDGTNEIIGEVGRGLRLRFNKEDAGKAGSRVGYAFTGMMDYNHLPYTYSDGTITTS